MAFSYKGATIPTAQHDIHGYGIRKRTVVSYYYTSISTLMYIIININS